MLYRKSIDKQEVFCHHISRPPLKLRHSQACRRRRHNNNAAHAKQGEDCLIEFPLIFKWHAVKQLSHKAGKFSF